MTYQSSFTGNQVDTAIQRVTDNEFASIVTASLNASKTSPMFVDATESYYLSPLITLDPNSRYIMEFSTNFAPTNVLGSSGINLAGQDIVSSADGIGFTWYELFSGGGTAPPEPSDLRTGNIVPIAVPGEVRIRWFNPVADPDTSLSRTIAFYGEVETGANPEIRFYYQGSNVDNIPISFRNFFVKFTKILPANIQAKDVTAPL